MKLKHDIEIVRTVECSDLEEFIRLMYNVSAEYYSFTIDVECGNDSTIEFFVKKEVLDSYDKKQLEAWKGGQGGGYMTQLLLTDLCNQELIDEGNYYIRVCW